VFQKGGKVALTFIHGDHHHHHHDHDDNVEKRERNLSSGTSKE